MQQVNFISYVSTGANDKITKRSNILALQAWFRQVFTKNLNDFILDSSSDVTKSFVLIVK